MTGHQFYFRATDCTKHEGIPIVIDQLFMDDGSYQVVMSKPSDEYPGLVKVRNITSTIVVLQLAYNYCYLHCYESE